MSNYDIIKRDVESLMHQWSERVILRTVFKILYYVCCCAVALGFFFCLVCVPGTSDYETIAGASGVETHSTMFFVLCELGGALEIAVTWLLAKGFDYLVWVQNTHVVAYQEQIEQGLADLDYEVFLIEQRAEKMTKKNEVRLKLLKNVEREVSRMH